MLAGRQLATPFAGTFSVAIALALIAAALALAWPLRVWLLTRILRFLQHTPIPPNLNILSAAVARIFVATLFIAAAGQIARAALELAWVLLPQTAVLADTVAIAIGMAGLGLGLGQALRSPDDPDLRPLKMPHDLDQAIAIMPLSAGILLGMTNVIERMSRALPAGQSSWVLAQGLIFVIETGMMAWFLAQVGKARAHEVAASEAAGTRMAVPAIFGLTVLAWGALALGAGAFFVGQIRFAMLVSQELLWAGLVLTIAWLLTGFIDALMAQLFDANRPAGRFATLIVGLQRARVRQATLLASAVLTVAVWLFAIGMVAAPLRGDHRAVIDLIGPTMVARTLHSLSLSPQSLVTAVLVLALGVALTRMIRGWLEMRFLPSTSLDIGAKTSIVTGLTYGGIIIAVLMASNTLGLQLEKITLIASALSVGIGFGLQSIIQNFVSGVILLIERPAKIGDWIAVGGAEGTIRKIRVRATELATADGCTTIVPNSSFITANVANRGDTLMPYRIDLSLTVKGCASAAEACDAVRRMVSDCTQVRSEPAPELTLVTLGEAQWGFVLRCYASPATSVAQARSALLFSLAAQTNVGPLQITSA